MFLWNLSSVASMLCLISNLAFNLFTPTILNCSPLFLDCLRVILDAWSIHTHSLCSGKFWEKIHHMLLIRGAVSAFLFFYLFIYHSTLSGYITSRILSGHYFLIRMSHIRNLARPPFPYPDVSHPDFCPGDVLPSLDISYPTPDVGWERGGDSTSPVRHVRILVL